MMMSSPDPDVVRWGLHTLMDVCAISNAGSSCSVTHYERETGTIEYVREGYNSVSPTNNVENDAVIASALQEELSRIAAAEASGIYDHEEDAILAQDWVGDHVSCFPCEKLDGDEVRIHHVKDDMDSDNFLTKEDDHSNKEKVEGTGDIFIPLSSSGDTENCSSSEDFQCWSNIADEYCLDGEVGKRLNTMASIPHVPKINGQIPAEDEEMSDHERLLDRLQVYDLVENKIAGDGNCQFRSLSDQLYRSSDHHKYVREQVVYQLKCHPEIYEGCVPMPYEEYLKRMSKSGEWGDHVTLQAAADVYGVKIFVITSFKDTCYIEILPHVQKSNRIIFLSFWAEVHYNSIYPQGELPSLKKKKKWWFGL